MRSAMQILRFYLGRQMLLTTFRFAASQVNLIQWTFNILYMSQFMYSLHFATFIENNIFCCLYIRELFYYLQQKAFCFLQTAFCFSIESILLSSVDSSLLSSVDSSLLSSVDSILLSSVNSICYLQQTAFCFLQQTAFCFLQCCLLKFLSRKIILLAIDLDKIGHKLS